MSTMEKTSETKQNDKIFDIKGVVTGVPVTLKLAISLPIAVIIYLLFSMLPLDAYGPMAAKGLGLFIAVIFMLIMCPVNIAVRVLMIVLSGFFLGFWKYSDIQSTLGSSYFLQITAMMLVGLGVETTPLGRRISLWLLCRLGQKPVNMIIVVGAVSCLLSAFISNIAIIIMMSSIVNGVLQAMGEKPGESKFGKVIMLVTVMGAMVGGCVLFCGNPVGNGMSLQLMQASSGYTVTFAQWAMFGIPTYIICMVPFCLVYVFYFKLDPKEVKMLPKSFYNEQFKKLGPVGGSEIRWVIIVVGMVVMMLCGVNTTIAALIAAFVTMMPVIGTGDPKTLWKKTPFDLMFAMGLIAIMGKLITTTGVSALLADLLMPILGGMSPLLFSITISLIAGLAVKLFLNASSAIGPMFLSIVPPICVSMGYNPVVVMMPMIFVATFFFVMGAHSFMLPNYSYGYWKINDPLVPGLIVIVMGSILIPLIVFGVSAIAGIPVYIG